MNLSRNQLIEQLLSECVAEIERPEGPGVPPTIRELSARIGNSTGSVSLDDLQRDFVQLSTRLERAVANQKTQPNDKPRENGPEPKRKN